MSLKEELEKIRQITTPQECVDTIINCLEDLYCNETDTGLKRLPKELWDYSGLISLALDQAKLLKIKL